MCGSHNSSFAMCCGAELCRIVSGCSQLCNDKNCIKQWSRWSEPNHSSIMRPPDSPLGLSAPGQVVSPGLHNAELAGLDKQIMTVFTERSAGICHADCCVNWPQTPRVWIISYLESIWLIFRSMEWTEVNILVAPCNRTINLSKKVVFALRWKHTYDYVYCGSTDYHCFFDRVPSFKNSL